MKPQAFRHLTARSRKRVLRRLTRQWQDQSNEVAHWESEKYISENYNDRPAASWASMRLAFAERRLNQLTRLLQ